MRSKIRKILSWLLGAVAGAIIIAVAGEWFIEVAKDKGWYRNAGENWDSAMSVVLSYLAQPGFYVPFTGFVGLVGGLWLDAALKVFEPRNRKPKEIDWNFLEVEIDRLKTLLVHDIHNVPEAEGDHSPISQETVSSFYALLFYLHRRGMAPQDGIPNPKLMTDAGFFFEIATRYIAAIEPFIRAKDPESVSSFGEMAINLVYSWNRESSADDVKAESPSPQSPQEIES